MLTTVDQQEIDKFNALSNQWWDQRGPMAPLHAFTPIRIDYILQTIKRFFPGSILNSKNGGEPLQSLKILDIGCGGGLIAEPLARLGASVTGIDVTETAIQAAVAHAKKMRLEIEYKRISTEDLASSGVMFDVICASEVIEHVADRPLFIQAIAKMLAPNGVVIITTINRTLPALLFAKFALEYLVRIIPAGTHDPNKFVKPNELKNEFAQAGILIDDMTGFAPRLGGGFKAVSSLAINYAASGGFR